MGVLEECGTPPESEAEDSEWEDDVSVEDWEDYGEGYDEEPPVEESIEAAADDCEPFVDEAFPPNMESLGKTEGDTASGVVGDASGEWVRLGTVVGEEGSLFKDIHSNDVNQGMLGNCWFLAACAAVANYPAWIKQMFSKTPELRKDGRYEVRLYHPGKKAFHYIVVSDEVPAVDGRPLFSQPTTSNEMWPCLVEKAFSKFCKNYAETEGGFPVFGMTYLCGGVGEVWEKKDGIWHCDGTVWAGGEGDQIEGKRTQTLEVSGAVQWTGYTDDKTQDKLWSALLGYVSKNFPMCCSVNEEQEDMQGLISGHAYSLITVRSVKTKEGKVLKLCKVRNPHGETEWQGRWSDKSDMWTKHPNVKKNLKFKP